MDIIEDVIADPSVVFAFPEPEELSGGVFLRIEKGYFGYT